MYILGFGLLFVISLGEVFGKKDKVVVCDVPKSGDITKVKQKSVDPKKLGNYIYPGSPDYFPYQFPDPEDPSTTILTCKDPCIYDVCQNGGICSFEENPPFPYTCSCVDGWIGPNCNIDPCAPNPCQNSGTCSRTPSGQNSFTCNCVNGWSGATCNMNPCTPNPCLHGTCSLTPSGTDLFTCTCESGWYGSVCDSNSVCDPPCGPDQMCYNHVCTTKGQLFFRLIWEGNYELDLYVTTPNNKVIYVDNPGASGLETDWGRYERDSSALGPENVYWSDNVPTPPSGVYHICANDFDASGGNPEVHTPITFDYGYDGHLHTQSFISRGYDRYQCNPTTNNYMFSYTYPEA